MEDKGLAASVADGIGRMVQRKGDPMALLAALLEEGEYGKHAGAAAALADLGVLFKYMQAMGSLDRCVLFVPLLAPCITP